MTRLAMPFKIACTTIGVLACHVMAPPASAMGCSDESLPTSIISYLQIDLYQLVSGQAKVVKTISKASLPPSLVVTQCDGMDFYAIKLAGVTYFIKKNIFNNVCYCAAGPRQNGGLAQQGQGKPCREEDCRK